MDFEKILKEIVERGKEESASDWLENINDEFGSVPLIFRRMAERPEVLLSHLLYKETIAETSTLDPKYVELISLAVGAALNCNHCLEYHMEGALTKGATREEILEVILIAGSLAQATVLADAYRVMDQKVNKVSTEGCNASCDLSGINFRTKKQD